jgi:uncharacterized membrane protein
MTAKKKFQIDRIALFSDAVFAIAITLMVIEVKPPHYHHHVSNKDALEQLWNLLPMFGGVILSFILIGRFWIWHHQLMKHIDNYNSRLLRLNLRLLLPIVCIPFATAFVFENVMSMSPVPLVFYNAVYILATIFNYQLYKYVLNAANGILSPEDPARIEHYRFALLFDIGIYLLVVALSFVDVRFAPMAYATLAMKGRLVKRYAPDPALVVTDAEDEE